MSTVLVVDVIDCFQRETNWCKIKQRRWLRIGAIFIQRRVASRRRRVPFNSPRRRRRRRRLGCTFHGNGNASSLMWRRHGNGANREGWGVDGEGWGSHTSEASECTSSTGRRNPRYRATTFFVHLRALFRAGTVVANGTASAKAHLMLPDPRLTRADKNDVNLGRV